MKKVKCGEGFLVDKNWRPIVRQRAGAMAAGRRRMPADLKRMGFGVAVFEADDYYRVNYGRAV